jgi:hypothetical protein
VGKDGKPSTRIGINEKHIKDRVVNVPKDVYFGV